MVIESSHAKKIKSSPNMKVVGVVLAGRSNPFSNSNSTAHHFTGLIVGIVPLYSKFTGIGGSQRSCTSPLPLP